MAINIVTPPTAGAPVDTNDYDAQNNLLQALLYSIMQNPLLITEWDTTNEPEIKQGVYIQHGGSLYLVEDNNEAIGGTPSSGRTFIKLTEAAGVITASFVNSASGYSWNQIYNGFYHADGTQLLPYILFNNSGSYYKFERNRLVDLYDISSTIIWDEIMSIGAWDMSTATGTATKVVATTTPFGQIIGVEAIVINDLGTVRHVITAFTDGADPNLLAGGVVSLGAASVTLGRRAGGTFDGANWNDTLTNRGTVKVEKYFE